VRFHNTTLVIQNLALWPHEGNRYQVLVEATENCLSASRLGFVQMVNPAEAARLRKLLAKIDWSHAERQRVQHLRDAEFPDDSRWTISPIHRQATVISGFSGSAARLQLWAPTFQVWMAVIALSLFEAFEQTSQPAQEPSLSCWRRWQCASQAVHYCASQGVSLAAMYALRMDQRHI